MQQAIGQLMPLAVAAGVAVTPLVALIALLTSKGGGGKGIAFVLGWFISEIVLVGVFSAIGGAASDSDSNSGPAPWVGWVQIGFGLLLAYLAVGQWRSRPKPGEQAKDPAWMKGLDDFSTAKSAGLGVGLAVVNTKNLPMALSASSVVAKAGVSVVDGFLLALFFAVVATVLLVVPLVIYFGFHKRSAEILGDMRNWLRIHGNVMMTVVLGLIGALMLGNGIGTV